MRVERLALGVQIYLGDCREILPTLPFIDAVVTDPPYGIGADEAASKNNGKCGWKYYGETQWDRERPEAYLLASLLKLGKYQIIWGGNYFTDILPPTMQWLIWDKGQRDFSLADLEMAWSSQKAASRIFTYSRAMAKQDGKEHPTQKPVELMKWCLGFLPPPPLRILDPFLGSGSTGVAAVKLGYRFIGIEIDENYFAIACRRIAEALKQSDLFIAPPKPAKQEAFEL